MERISANETVGDIAWNTVRAVLVGAATLALAIEAVFVTGGESIMTGLDSTVDKALLGDS